MTTFDDRERDAERRFEHDEQLRFKAAARRNRLLGEWAAGELGLAGDEATAYAKDVVMADFEEPGDDDVLRKVQADFEAKGLPIDARKIRLEMDRLMQVARKQIMEE